MHRLPTVNAQEEEDIFALSKSSFNPGQSSIWQAGQSGVSDSLAFSASGIKTSGELNQRADSINDSLAFSASGIKTSGELNQRADSNNDSLAFSASGVSGKSLFNRSRSSAMSKTGKPQRKSSLKRRSGSMKSSGGTMRKGRKPGEQIVDF